jgi:aspartyl-tRNA(Asn)/glutamyl-tRNA(Gln) amidotransferase subunit B
LVDLNRASTPLIEMVTEPDIRSSDEAREFLQKVRAIAQSLGVSDANPEEGKMRADVNVSVRRPGEPFGTKVEVKNLNSFKSVQRALEFEIKRQSRIIEDGGKITQATLGWDDGGQKTYLMRTKEEAADYRYFPDPDLPPMKVSQEWLESLRSKTPELPDAKLARYLKMGLRDYDASLIAFDVALSQFFDDTTKHYTNDAQNIANWLNGDVMGYLNAQGLELAQAKLRPEHLALLIKLIDNGTISGKIAKDLIPDLMQGADPEVLVKERGLVQIADTGAIETILDDVLAANQELVERVKANPKAINALLGEAMKASKGKAKPDLVRELLNKKLGL